MPDLDAPETTDPRPGTNDMIGAAAGAIVLAMVLIAVSGLITALAFDVRPGIDELTVRVKLMSLSQQFLYGFTSGGGSILVAIGLAVALGLARSAAKTGANRQLVTAVAFGAVALSVWLGLLAALGIYVDVTQVAEADLAAAAALGDVATLVVLLTTGVWGFGLAGSPRR